MFDGGLIDEVEGLLASGYSPDLKTMQTIGYRQAVRFLQFQAVFEVVDVLALHHFANKAADLAHIAGDFGKALLGCVQLLQNHHGNEHVVLFEAEDRGRVVHQHVRVENIQAFLTFHV